MFSLFSCVNIRGKPLRVQSCKYFKHIQFAQTGTVFANLLLHHQSAFSTALHNFTMMDRKPHVAVIGAGMAGLRCADILIQNGVKVTLFEARNRVGGRVCQEEIDGHSVDLGPNWIHGTRGNPITDIAQLTSTTTVDWDGLQSVYSSDGKLLDNKFVTKISEFLWTTIGEAFQYSNEHKDTISPDRSLLDFFRERVEDSGFMPVEKAACMEYCKLWGAYVGESVERQSLKFFCLEECIDGNNLFVASTYKNILEHASKTALQGADLHLNEPVVRVEAHPRGSGQRNQITLSTATGKSYRLDEVVVTCPLGWLKRNKSAFYPELSPHLHQAIDNISYGRLEKVYVTFPKPFWHTVPEESNPIATTAAVNGGKPTNAAPTMAQFLDPTYVQHPEGISWNQECLSLASLPDTCAHPTLLFYTYGPCATHIVSKIANLPPSSDEYYSVLNDFLYPFYSRLKGFSPSSPACKPTAFLATQWQNDPYAGNGSYCNFQIGLKQGDKDIETLRRGLGMERGIWFAGEHTAPFVALGTTTGAYWSGERAAGQICDLYSLTREGIGSGRDDSLPSATGKKVHLDSAVPAMVE